MGPMLVTLIVTLLGVTAGFPAEDEDLGRAVTPEYTDRQALAQDRRGSRNEALPRVSECNLIALINEQFGSTNSSNCSKLVPVHPINEITSTIEETRRPGTRLPITSPETPLDNMHCTSISYSPVPCQKYPGGFDDPIDVRTRPTDEGCFQYITTCCPKEPDSRTPDYDTLEPGSTWPTTTETRITETTTKKEFKEPDPQPNPHTGQCGIRNTGGIKTASQIGWRLDRPATGAKLTEYGEFPWMVAIIRPDEYNESVTVYQCGGSLIHPQVVLTAAHCVLGFDNLTITVGEWDMVSKDEPYPTQNRHVEQVIFHEALNNVTFANGFALLILDAPVDTGVESAGLICLPEQNEDMDGRQCVASGWGKDSLDIEAKYYEKLKRVDLPIVPREPCLQALSKTRLGPYFKLHESFLCAGGVPDQDTCKGDGGGPLVCPSRNNPDVYVQAGIVVKGIECNTEAPALYVDVSRYVDWIDSTLRKQGFNIPTEKSDAEL